MFYYYYYCYYYSTVVCLFENSVHITSCLCALTTARMMLDAVDICMVLPCIPDAKSL